MKKLMLFLMCILLLTGCGTAQLPASEPATEPTIQPPQVIDYFDYEYLHENPRDLAWEEDIVFFAKTMLGTDTVDGQPYLTTNTVEIMSSDVGTSEASEYRSLYNEYMHQEFLESVSALIGQIPNLTDMQIQYELRRIVCALEDCHSQMLVQREASFPLAVELLECDGELGLYAVRLPVSFGHLIYAKLIAINDIPIEEVFQKMAPYLNGESSWGALAMFANITKGNYLARLEALQAAGIVSIDTKNARFRFLSDNGEEEIILEAVPAEVGYTEDLINLHHVNAESLSWSQYLYEDYFFRYFPDDDTLYIRLYSVPGNHSGKLSGFIANIKKVVQEQNGVRKTILDLRDNGGGTPDTLQELTDFLKEPITGMKYILINEACFSASVSIPYSIRTASETAAIIGSPAAQGPNSPYHNNQLYTMKNHGLEFYFSMGFVELNPNYEYDTLIPDIYIYQNLDDYINGVDTVLETVWNLPA